MNRLKLDFTLESAQERSDFINTYITTLDNINASEANTIANYLLWGKDKVVPRGKFSRQPRRRTRIAFGFSYLCSRVERGHNL